MLFQYLFSNVVQICPAQVYNALTASERVNLWYMSLLVDLHWCLWLKKLAIMWFIVNLWYQHNWDTQSYYDEFVSGVAETEMEIALQDSDSGSDDHESECTTEMYV